MHAYTSLPYVEHVWVKGLQSINHTALCWGVDLIEFLRFIMVSRLTQMLESHPCKLHADHKMQGIPDNLKER